MKCRFEFGFFPTDKPASMTRMYWILMFHLRSHDQHINRLNGIKLNLKSSKTRIHSHTWEIRTQTNVHTHTIPLKASTLPHRPTQSLCYLIKFVSTPERDVRRPKFPQKARKRNRNVEKKRCEEGGIVCHPALSRLLSEGTWILPTILSSKKRKQNETFFRTWAWVWQKEISREQN